MSQKVHQENRKSRNRIRAQVLRELRGASEPKDLNDRVSRADEWITKVLEKVGVKGGLEEEKVKETWRVLAGEAIASQTEPVSLRKGCLILKVLQPSMKYHLEQLKGSLLKKLQEELGAEHVKSLRLVIG